MQATGIDAFERTIQKSNEWLRDIQRGMGVSDKQLAYRAMRATLHALRDRLNPYEAVHLGAQLPTLIRGVYYEGWRFVHTPSGIRTAEEFLGVVAAEAGQPDLGRPDVARAVFHVLENRISPGEIEDVLRSLPEPIRALWGR